MNSEWADQPQPQSGKLGPGAQLKAQREAMGWSVEQVADQLKLAQRQVLALEAGDMAALPNVAVVRGFIRAYAKVVKMDAAPLVAMIEVETGATPTSPAPVRREMAATTFSETRFPSLTQRSKSRPTAVYAALAVLVVAGAAFGAYKLGYISPAMLMHGGAASVASASASASATGTAETPAAAAAPTAAGQPVETTLVKPGQPVQEGSTLQSTSVPLISVPPPPADGSSAAGATASAANPAATAAATTAAATKTAATDAAPAANVAAAATAAAPAGANTLVLTVTQDSWIEVRRKTGSSLAARLVKGGSTESFEITEPALLVVGKPDGVSATLRGAPLALPHNGKGETSRVNIK